VRAGRDRHDRSATGDGLERDGLERDGLERDGLERDSLDVTAST